MRQASLPGQGVEHVRTDGLLQLTRSYLLIGTVIDPEVRGRAVAVLPELIDEPTEAAAEEAAQVAHGLPGASA